MHNGYTNGSREAPAMRQSFSQPSYATPGIQQQWADEPS